jgi:hypothetical protein
MHDNIDMVDTGKTSRKKGKTVGKPKPVLDKGMAGVRTEYDQQLASYPLMPCYLKTYKKTFYLFDRMLFNAYSL